MSVERALSDALVRFLTHEVTSYQRRIPNNLDNLKKHIRPGDVLLVEGKSRVSQVIKYVTQSSWSHSTIYVGERPLQGDGGRTLPGPLRRGGAATSWSRPTSPTASSAVPLSKYAEYNIRVCRPYCLGEPDLERVLEEVVAHIGDRYDRRQLFDLGRYLTPFHLLPMRWRRKAFFSGESDSRAVICSSLIARAFLGVRYPILPVLPASVREEKADGLFPWGTRVRSPHPAAGPAPRLRPLALLPHREVQLRRRRRFDYQRLEWLEPLAAPARGKSEARRPE